MNTNATSAGDRRTKTVAVERSAAEHPAPLVVVEPAKLPGEAVAGLPPEGIEDTSAPPPRPREAEAVPATRPCRKPRASDAHVPKRLAVSIVEAAEAIGVSVATIKREVARGRLRVTRVGLRRVVIRVADLEEYLEESGEKALTFASRRS